MKQSKMEKLFDEFKTNELQWIGKCHDCKGNAAVIATRTPEGIKITGGAVYEVEIEENKKLFFKCDGCFLKNQVLHNYQPCEVFSRTVGYYRPVNNMNGAKQSEFHIRKNFKIPGEQHNEN